MMEVWKSHGHKRTVMTTKVVKCRTCSQFGFA